MRLSPFLWLGGLLIFPLLAQAEPPSPARFENAIVAFEAADRENAPPEGAILFIGSSSIRGWRTLADDFPEYKVINRGFGGSVITDSIAFADRIVLPYKPSTILFYAGENDLKAGVTPQEVAKNFEAFVALVHRTLPDTRIAFISMKPSPSRASLIEEMREGNDLIQVFSAETPMVDYIDVFNPMLNTEGKARQELFVQDNLHLNAAGYKLWREIVSPYLRSIE